ncbi:MAG: DUF6785 family protein [Candidatus Zipacnadales bacterium]
MTPRAFLIGIASVLLLSIGTPYSDLVMRGTWVGLTAFPISSLFVLLVLVLLVNMVLGRLGRALSSGEMLFVYTMVLVAAGIPSFGLTALLIPYLAGPFYFASPENRYAEILHPYIPRWFHPQSEVSITALYEGLRGSQTIPWGEWLTPLAAWSVLVLAVYAVFFCLSAILRKRWVDDEKLVFPLVQLPVEMSQQSTEGNRWLGPFFRNPLMWGFFLGPFLLHGVNGLHYYYPSVPTINVHLISLDGYIPSRPWNAMSPLWLRFLFSIIGLAYLLPQDLSFSLWFFYFFFLVQQVIASALGYQPGSVQAYPVRKFVAHQMIAGIILYAIYHLWASKARLEEVWRRAWTGEASVDDTREPMSFRTAALGLGIGLVVICLWGGAAGASVHLTFVIFALYFLVHLVAVRLVCEGGMLYVQHPYRPLNLMLAAVGSRSLGAPRLTTLALFDHLFMLDNRSPLMPGIMQGYKIADAAGMSRRQLTWGMVVAVVLAMGTSYVSYLRLMYRHGGAAMNPWFTTYYTNNLYCTWTSHLIAAGEAAQPREFLTMAVGAATMWGLLFMHRTFLWWPLHPIGYLMGASWPMINFWFPILLGWLVKTVIMRYGGAKLYRKLLPGFLGLVLAEFVSAGIWVPIDALCGVRGHQIFSF